MGLFRKKRVSTPIIFEKIPESDDSADPNFIQVEGDEIIEWLRAADARIDDQGKYVPTLAFHRNKALIAEVEHLLEWTINNGTLREIIVAGKLRSHWKRLVLLSHEVGDRYERPERPTPVDHAATTEQALAAVEGVAGGGTLPGRGGPARERAEPQDYDPKHPYFPDHAEEMW